MRPLRQIREITSGTITIAVPDSLLHHKVEIIIVPLEESVAATKEVKPGENWPTGFLERFAVSLPDFNCSR